MRYNRSHGAILTIAVAAWCLIPAAAPPANGTLQVRPVPYLYTSAETNSAVAKDLERELARYRRDHLLNRATPSFSQAQRVFEQLVPGAGQESDTESGFEWALYVHAGRWAEAYARAGGKIVLSEPFLDRYRLDDSELALVIGHEMVHAICEHERVQLSALLRNSAPHPLYIGDAIALLGGEEPDAVPDLSLIHRLENIADREGLRLAARAGFNPASAIQFFAKLERLDQDPGFFPPTHESPVLRRAHLQHDNFWLSLVPTMFQRTTVDCRS